MWFFCNYSMTKEQLLWAPLYTLTPDQREARKKLQAAKRQATFQIAHGSDETYRSQEKDYKRGSRGKR